MDGEVVPNGPGCPTKNGNELRGFILWRRPRKDKGGIEQHHDHDEDPRGDPDDSL